MNAPDLMDLIKARIETATDLRITLGYLSPDPGVSLVLISAAPERRFYDRREIRRYAFTAHIKHQSQRTALQTAQAIGDALSRWTPPKDTEGFTINTVEHQGPFFIHREASTNYHIYGVEIAVDIYY